MIASEKISVLLVDRSTRFRDGLTSTLNSQSTISLSSVSNEMEMFLHLGTKKTDIVLYDLFELSSSIYQVIQSVKNVNEKIQIAFLSFETQDELIQECIKSGASGYFDKTITDLGLFVEMLHKIKAGESIVLAGQLA